MPAVQVGYRMVLMPVVAVAAPAQLDQTAAELAQVQEV
jgi:hypothetical protein